MGLDTLEESLLPIENRVKRGGRNIPAETIATSFGKRFDVLPTVLSYRNEAAFFDNVNGFVPVGRYKNGELQALGQPVPQGISELIEKMEDTIP